jgi:hypothetical protein
MHRFPAFEIMGFERRRVRVSNTRLCITWSAGGNGRYPEGEPPMKAVVLGAGGGLGRNVVNAAARAGPEVRVCSYGRRTKKVSCKRWRGTVAFRT